MGEREYPLKKVPTTIFSTITITVGIDSLLAKFLPFPFGEYNPGFLKPDHKRDQIFSEIGN